MDPEWDEYLFSKGTVSKFWHAEVDIESMVFSGRWYRWENRKKVFYTKEEKAALTNE